MYIILVEEAAAQLGQEAFCGSPCEASHHAALSMTVEVGTGIANHPSHRDVSNPTKYELSINLICVAAAKVYCRYVNHGMDINGICLKLDLVHQFAAGSWMPVRAIMDDLPLSVSCPRRYGPETQNTSSVSCLGSVRSFCRA